MRQPGEPEHLRCRAGYALLRLAGRTPFAAMLSTSMFAPGLTRRPRAPVRVLLVDDHVVFRAGLRALLERQAGVAVVDEAGRGDEAVERVRTVRPDVVLMDLAMPGQGGLEATRRFVDKAGPVEDLTRAIRTVMQGRRFLGADAARVVVLQRYLRARQVADAPKKRWGTSEGGRGEGAHP